MMAKKVLSAVLVLTLCLGVLAGCSDTNSEMSILGSWERVDEGSFLNGMVVTVVEEDGELIGVITELSDGAKNNGWSVGDRKWEKIREIGRGEKNEYIKYEFEDLSINLLDNEPDFTRMEVLLDSDNKDQINPKEYIYDEQGELEDIDVQEYKRVKTKTPVLIHPSKETENGYPAGAPSELYSEMESHDSELTELESQKSNTKAPVPQNEEKTTTQKETTSADIKVPEKPQAPETPQTPKPSTSYQAIFDTYSAKIKAATPGIVQEYIDESAGISDITTLAELSNAKIQKLAEISNDGITEMAQLMYDTNGSYDEYESWAGKLTDVYMEEAAKISDAYMDSVM